MRLLRSTNLGLYGNYVNTITRHGVCYTNLPSVHLDAGAGAIVGAKSPRDCECYQPVTYGNVECGEVRTASFAGSGLNL